MTVKLRKLFYACLLVIRCVPPCGSIEISKTLLNAEFNNLNIQESKIFETFSVSLIYCGILCLDTENCLSFNYYKVTRTCKLFDVDFTGKESARHTIETGWLYYHLIRDFKKRPDGCDNLGTYHVCSAYCLNYVTGNSYSNLTSQCKDLDGEMVRIDRELKQFCVGKLLENESDGDVYVQGIKDESGVWRYNDGREMTYFKWNTAGGQPDNNINDIYIGVKKSKGLLWHDAHSDSFKATVCEEK